MPRCIDRTEGNGEFIMGYYAHHLTEVIGSRSYDIEGHRNTQFMDARGVRPYPDSCKNTWTATREEAMMNLGFRDDPEQEGWEKMGIPADPTPSKAKNRGAADRKKERGKKQKRGLRKGNNDSNRRSTSRRREERCRSFQKQ